MNFAQRRNSEMMAKIAACMEGHGDCALFLSMAFLWGMRDDLSEQLHCGARAES